MTEWGAFGQDENIEGETTVWGVLDRADSIGGQPGGWRCMERRSCLRKDTLMRKLTSLLLACVLLTGCGNPESRPSQEYESRFSSQTLITLSPEGITVNGGGETESVYVSRDITYYEDLNAYPSGNPYGEGEDWERHSSAEAQSHLVVNITAPGAYRIRGTLPMGQIRVDLGKKASDDPKAVVELILDGADITCTVAPAILFQNVYECDEGKPKDSPKAEINTEKAGANLILLGDNRVKGSHVARIYKDNGKGKKLWKQDAAIYSYMSLNILGPGALDLTGDNEGIGTERHLSVYGGRLTIHAGDDGINANEDGVSVVAIYDGELSITGGMRKEGDGIDANGYLVIYGGHVTATAHPSRDGGLDSGLETYIHGGTVVALGASRDWVNAGSRQVTMNLQFSSYQDEDSGIVVKGEDGEAVFDATLPEGCRQYSGAMISCPALNLGETYTIYIRDSRGQETKMGYTGTELGKNGASTEVPEGAFLMKDRVNAFSGLTACFD